MQPFPAADRAAVEAAVKEVESRSGGEVVVYAVERCDPYASAAGRSALVGALAAVLAAVLCHLALIAWHVPMRVWMALPPAAGAALGYLVARLSRRLLLALAGAAQVERRVRQRAAEAFLDEEVFATRERTGLLIFVALFERRVLILGDHGIHARVPAGAWQAISDAIAAALGQGEVGNGLAAGIRHCGELLARYRVERPPDDRNELDDRLRQERT